MTAALALVLAQSCTALLPPANVQLEWVLNGRPYASDVPTASTARTRTYRRTRESGERATRTLACTTTSGTSVLVETIDDEVQVRLPVTLGVGATRTVSGASVRRIAPPAGGAREALWFTTTRNLVRMYALRAGVGIAEYRVQSARGGVDVYRASAERVKRAQPAPNAAAAEARLKRLAAQADSLERQQRLLQDSVRLLESVVFEAREAAQRAERLRAAAESTLVAERAPRSPLDERLVSMLAAQVYFERGEYAETVAVLSALQAQIQEFERLTGVKYPATAAVSEFARKAARQKPRAANKRQPFRYDQVVRLLQGGIAPERIAEQAAVHCLAFAVDEAAVAALQRVGAPVRLVQQLAAVCRA